MSYNCAAAQRGSARGVANRGYFTRFGRQRIDEKRHAAGRFWRPRTRGRHEPLKQSGRGNVRGSPGTGMGHPPRAAGGCRGDSGTSGRGDAPGPGAAGPLRRTPGQTAPAGRLLPAAHVDHRVGRHLRGQYRPAPGRGLPLAGALLPHPGAPGPGSGVGRPPGPAGQDGHLRRRRPAERPPGQPGGPPLRNATVSRCRRRTRSTSSCCGAPWKTQPTRGPRKRDPTPIGASGPTEPTLPPIAPGQNRPHESLRAQELQVRHDSQFIQRCPGSLLQ